MERWNIFFGWAGMLLGAVLGMVYGLKAESRDWAGGYGSFRRQTLRLAHVAAFALGMINVLFGLTASPLAAALAPWVARAGSIALIAGGLLMPTVCLLAAWRRGLKYLFPLPATCVMIALAVQVWRWWLVARGG